MKSYGKGDENMIFEDVWKKIIFNEGQAFNTKTGKEFKYSIINNALITSVTDYKLSKSNFEKAFMMLPLDGPGQISKLVRGPAYVWAILNDKRIK